MKAFLRYLLNVAVGVDQLANAVLIGNPHSTISARAYIAEQKGQRWGCVLCRVLARIQPNHCAISFAAQIAADEAQVTAGD